MYDDYDSYGSQTNDAESRGVLDELRQEYESIQTRLEEARLQISQSKAEVERWERELASVDRQLRHIHTNFDTVPRADIRTAYDAFLETQNRLFMTRNQLEKLEEKIAEMEAYENLFERILHEYQDSITAGTTYATTPDRPHLTESGEIIIRIVEAQEDERQVLAKQLHDGPAQSLSNFILQAEVCQRLFDRNPDRAASELGNLKTAASDSFQKVRDFIFDLRPMMLDDLGLIPTLRRYTENLSQKTDEFNIDFKSTSEERRISKHAEVIMFRSIQQLLTLSRDYLNAETVRIQIDISGDQVRATIEDDGKGFNPETELDPANGDSNVQVLNSLRDRIELVSGDMEIYSIEGQDGSRFAIRLPLFEEEPEF